MRVEIVRTGDAALDDRTRELVLAAREAIRNAAAHSGSSDVSVFVDAAGRVHTRSYAIDPALHPRPADSLMGRVALVEGGHTVFAKVGNLFAYLCAAATVFPEMGVFLVPYLVKSYDQAYKMFNVAIGDRLDRQFQDKYKLKVLCFYDYGFRHFWNNRRPIAAPKDLRGLKLRVQPAKVFADTINGLGGVAVPMAWGEVIPAAQQGVIDGADLPIINILMLKAYEVSKYASMTYHNYGPTVSVINLEVWNGLTKDEQKLLLDVAREAQERIRKDTESVDNFAKAKELLEPKGMTVNEADVEAFRRVARDKVWPAYQKQYSELWEEIVNTKV